MERVQANIGKFGRYQFEFIDHVGTRAARKKWIKFMNGMVLRFFVCYILRSTYTLFKMLIFYE